jgi:polysaccharide export outer membrane protein
MKPEMPLVLQRLLPWLVFSLAGLIALTLLVGCSKGLTAADLDRKSPTTGFLLGPEDVLEVVVWRSPDLSRQVVVRPDGMISMPLIGDVQAAGQTSDQLATRIAKLLTPYKESPNVSVSVKEVNSYAVFVLGEVAKPGKYQLKSYTTVLQMISMAGGFTPFASKNKLQIVRQTLNGNGGWREERIAVPYSDLLKGRGDPEYYILKGGDTLVVP